MRCSGVANQNGIAVATFDGGTEIEADIIVGADGIRSKVRDILLGAERPRFTGRVAQRAIFPAARLSGHVIRDCAKWWGPDRHLLAYYLTRRRDEVYLMGSVPAATWESEELALPCQSQDFCNAFANFHPDIRRAVEVATDITVMPICDRERHDCWSSGRAVLLGDACHPVRPYMAAGGAMAVEDAAVLSRCLESFDDIGEAFQRYEAMRIPRVAEVQRISIENSWMRGPTDVDWFFGYDACTVPLTASDMTTGRVAVDEKEFYRP